MNDLTIQYKNIERQAKLEFEQIANRIIASEKMSRQDYTIISSFVTKNGYLNEAGRRLINRIFDYIQTGRMKLVDW